MILTLFGISLAVNFLLLASCRHSRRRARHFSICPAYGIPTRAALEQKWSTLSRRTTKLSVVFCDLDHMHTANEQFGYQEVDRRIRIALQSVRHAEIWRWYSGDEFVILCSVAEALQAAQRLQAAFQQQGLSATFGIAPCQSVNLLENVAQASDLVQQAKQKGRRGAILQAYRLS